MKVDLDGFVNNLKRHIPKRNTEARWMVDEMHRWIKELQAEVARFEAIAGPHPRCTMTGDAQGADHA